MLCPRRLLVLSCTVFAYRNMSSTGFMSLGDTGVDASVHSFKQHDLIFIVTPKVVEPLKGPSAQTLLL